MGNPSGRVTGRSVPSMVAAAVAAQMELLP